MFSWCSGRANCMAQSLTQIGSRTKKQTYGTPLPRTHAHTPLTDSMTREKARSEKGHRNTGLHHQRYSQTDALHIPVLGIEASTNHRPFLLLLLLLPLFISFLLHVLPPLFAPKWTSLYLLLQTHLPVASISDEGNTTKAPTTTTH